MHALGWALAVSAALGVCSATTDAHLGGRTVELRDLHLRFTAAETHLALAQAKATLPPPPASAPSKRRLGGGKSCGQRGVTRFAQAGDADRPARRRGRGRLAEQLADQPA